MIKGYNVRDDVIRKAFKSRIIYNNNTSNNKNLIFIHIVYLFQHTDTDNHTVMTHYNILTSIHTLDINYGQ